MLNWRSLSPLPSFLVIFVEHAYVYFFKKGDKCVHLR